MAQERAIQRAAGRQAGGRWRRRALFVLAAVFVLGLSLSACGGGGAKESSGSPASGPATEGQGSGGEAAGPIEAKIGAVLILSGGAAAYGEAQRSGLEMAKDELNEKYAGKLKLDIVYEDTGGKKESAINAVNKLINEDRVVAIIGPTLSAEMFAAGPVANENETPIFGISNTAEGINDIGPYVFRNSLPESIAIPTAMKAAQNRYHFKTAALIYANNDDFSVSGYKTMKKTAEELGLEIVAEESFAVGDVDFSAQLTNIKKADPDVLLISALYKEGALVVKKAREMGLRARILGGNGFNNPKVFEIAGDAAEGLIVATPFSPEKNDPKVQAFVKAYEARYGKKPDQFAAQAYDGLTIIAESLLKAGKADRKLLRDQLAELKDFEGVSGKLSFDERRNPIGEAVVVVAKGGKYVPLESVSD
ncbi:MAG: Branched-chain amino acid ABC transporter, amino acid-binding protein [Hydrogenibacillus schlegelii]|uniref:Branched-chain amino acid ABC transporter, amino acid-binding protein n=1 Tax=Hydrogenibacillus schlegelii TaxID=1484 RepID=A0A2T5GFP0_HYDSH|nr:ABC transporter substrate-binding protein [Hydrogenibacillus schlegelii]PTQ55007.1 MAG: Branched-chain amino acid ABC transporter, amino acid-binding protein [Hydrogenibacillus schlegelii]